MDGVHSPFQIPQPGTMKPETYMFIEDLAVVSVFFGESLLASFVISGLTRTIGAFTILAFNTIRLLL